MRRRLRAVAAGLAVAVAGMAAGTAAADGAGPVASPPASPQTQTVSGVAANGVQLAVTAPAQLPLDLPGQQLPEREADVTVKDVGGQGYSGPVTLTLTPEGAGASAGSLRVDHYDPVSGLWQSEAVPSGQSSFTVTDTVAVPANGSQVLKLRLSPGTTAVDDVKLSVAANGASAVTTMPVTAPSFQASGLTAAARAGAPAVVSAKLSNPTDVDLQHVSVKLLLCSAGTAGCVAHASDVKVEVQQQSTGAWHVVPVADGAGSAMSATVVPDGEVPAGGELDVSARVTVGAGAFAQASGPTSGSATGSASGSATGSTSGTTPGQTAAQPLSVPLALGPVGLTLSGQPTMTGTLTVQPPPQQPATSTPPSTPSTPSSSGTSATPTATPSATPTATDSGAATPTTAAPTGGPTSDPATSNEAASTPSSSSSGSPTVLVAAGLLAVCLALVLWWVLMKRRERVALPADGTDAEHDSTDSGTDIGTDTNAE